MEDVADPLALVVLRWQSTDLEDKRHAIEVEDRKLRRAIRIEKSGGASTVLWNPWIAKAQQMPDFGNEEYKQMVCVESGNVAKNRISLPPGRTSMLKVILSSSRL